MLRKMASVTLGLLGTVALAWADSSSSSANQVLANRVARQLQECGTLRDFTIHVLAQGGTVILHGEVQDAEQMAEALRQARQVPGVGEIVNQLNIRPTSNNTVQSAQYSAPPALLSPPNLAATTSDTEKGAPLPPEPVPSYRVPVPAHGYIGTPPLPPIAWPTYAPYNNFSRVAYPTCYPYEAFPYFGPFYPFPKVPLGWRAVKLEWNDGFWFLSTHAQRYDYWVLRFW